MAGTRRALLIGIEHYDDARLSALPSCRADLEEMQKVLRNPGIGSFDEVTVRADLTAAELRRAIGVFLDAAGPDDLALLYLSGHGERVRYGSGEFYFVARDSDFDRLEQTAVSASFVNELLEECPAPQKVTIIDACASGGFALGFRTRDTKGPAAEAPLRSRGVYVLSSSGAAEASYSGPMTDEGPAPSVFTGEIVEVLRDGSADPDGDGKVSVVDLFNAVSERVRRQEPGSRQVPVYSAIGVNSPVVIAQVLAGGSIGVDDGVPAGARSGPIATVFPEPREPSWADLIDYYLNCLRAEQPEEPLLKLTDEGERFVVLPERERMLSGGSNDDDLVDLDEPTAEWVRRVLKSDDGLWAGYPAVLRYGASGTKQSATLAPLVVRRVEAVEDATGGLRLQAVGPAQPHRGLARAVLGEDEAQHLIDTYYASWHAGGYGQMTRDLRHLLVEDYQLLAVEELRPDQLAAKVDLRTPTAGARNVALLYRVSERRTANAKLIEDLRYIRDRPAEIEGTALGALFGRKPGAGSFPAPLLVTPLECNDAQRAVIESAMTAHLTAATGPPGTGKSQLVTNVVATTITNRQTVLVASTNNTAVDEVWQRSRRLMPGMLIRTGSRTAKIDYGANETTELIELTGLSAPSRTAVTELADLKDRTTIRDRARADLGVVAEHDRDLLSAARRRAEIAGALGVAPDDLAARLGEPARASRWRRRARRCHGARIFAGRRRRRLLRSLELTTEPSAENCLAVAAFAEADAVWSELRAGVDPSLGDEQLAAAWDVAEAEVRAASARLAEATVREKARSHRRRIDDLLAAKQGAGSDWHAVEQAFTAAPGWAVSTLSARRFKTKAALFDLVVIDEASQCSIPQVLPLLFRARRALVIGDPMQLRHIVTITPDQEAKARRSAGIPADWLEGRHLTYRRHSAFHAAEDAAGNSLLLDEHYRCHPAIADFINRMFYGGRLTVLTDTRRQHRIDRPALLWAPVAGHPERPGRGGSWINLDEVKKVRDSVRYLLGKLPDEASVGVVTPFKAQADAIASGRPEIPEVRVGTVHTFQGGECDVVLFDLVAGPTMPSSSLAWLEADRNLWNVAISRARAHLIVIGDQTFWRGRRGVGGELAAAEEAGARAGADEPMLERLYALLSRIPGAAVELQVEVNGYRCDAVVRLEGRTTAVLLDRSDGTTGFARHLHLQYRRAALLIAPGEVDAAIRLPLWRLFDTAGSAPTVEGWLRREGF